MSINRLFTKIYLLLLATILIYFFSSEYLLDILAERWLNSEHTFLQYRFKINTAGELYLIEQELNHYPREQWRQRLDLIEQNSIYTLQLFTISTLPISLLSEQKQQITSGETVTVFDQDKLITDYGILGDYHIYKRFMNSDVVLQFAINEVEGLAEKEADFYSNFENIILIVNISGFVILAVVVFFWVRQLDKRLNKLHQAAQQFGAGQLDSRVPALGRDEIGQLADTFNAMAERIQKLIQGHKTLTDAVSHELRTPITRLRFELTMLEDSADKTAQQRYLQGINANVDELDKMVHELLVYARLERTTPPLHLRIYDLNKVVAEWIEQVQPDTQIPIQLHPSPHDAQVTISADYMQRAVSNLLRNAMRYAKTQIQVSIEMQKKQYCIHIDDDGMGIPTADRERLFQPFVRLDSSRSRSEGGYGLGLAIVKQIALWHQGDAVISDSPLGGARISIIWPIH
ncbi:ATP-binding protein [Candidatus Albibeggiatoa sp. nov. NOAA]|uniref:ATP-binding protein n=1 Tax=Candidatus Albibeggiatoa sp. nov. NOAA TaxID=3162724 RepID=UPI0032F9FD27|nr:ATP-binding protein [Thiotrichaceae bacterium]